MIQAHTTTNGHSELNFSNMADGVYHITIKSADLFYSTKLVIAR